MHLICVRSLVIVIGLHVLLSACQPSESKNLLSSDETEQTFVNPIMDQGADPFVTMHNGVYYRVYADGVSSIFVTRFDRIEEMRAEISKEVWDNSENEPYAKETWAPELIFLNERWYIYYTAGIGADHRMFVLESETEDPQGAYTYKGMLRPTSDAWAIDGTAFEHEGQLYFVWSGWDGARPVQQNIYIAPMLNPWTIVQADFIKRYEAESAAIRSGVRRQSRFASQGQAVGRLDYLSSSLNFKLEVPRSDRYAIDIHYSNGTPAVSSHKLKVNGVALDDLKYPSTSDWENWQTSHRSVDLHQGENFITLSYGNGPAEIDYLEVKTARSDRIKLLSPDESWERRGGGDFVAEGPEILKKNGKLHLVYSASASWTDDYTLGLSTFIGDDVMDPQAWVKKGQVFAKTDSVFGPGHCSFTQSPDGSEDWIIYHAAVAKGAGWNRNLRAQKFTWDQQSNPVFGLPLTAGSPLAVPRAYPRSSL